MGKAFDKQMKTIEDQGKKQIKAIQDKEKVKTIKKYSYDSENTPFISKQKEIFNELVDERLEKITDLDERVKSDNLIYRYKGNTADSKFDEFDNALGIINKIWDDKTDLADVKANQQQLKSFLGKIKKERNQKSKKALCAIFKCSIKQERKVLNFMMIIL